MSCRERERLHRVSLTLEEQRARAQHLADCPECQAASARLEDARRALRFTPPPFHPAERARWWQGIQHRLQPPPPRRLGWALGLAAAALAAMLLLWPGRAAEPTLVAGTAQAWEGGATWTTGQVVPSETWLRLDAGTVASLGEHRLATRTPAVALLALEPRSLRLFTGAVELSGPAEAEPLRVITPAAELSFLGGRAALQVEQKRTRVQVQSGAVTVGERTLPLGVELELSLPAPGGTVPGAAGGPAAERPAPPPRPTAPGASSGGVRSSAVSPGPSATAMGGDAPPPAGTPAREAAPPRTVGRGAPREDAAPDQLTEARALVGKDDARALDLARGVLARAPGGDAEAAALMIAADASRRRGEREAAAAYYQRAALHPAGLGFAEEAELRRAQLLGELGRVEEARWGLADLRRRFPGGALEPERIAEGAHLALRAADVVGAAAEVEGGRHPTEPVVARARLDVARALAGIDRARALRLLGQIPAAANATDPLAAIASEAHALRRELGAMME